MTKLHFEELAEANDLDLYFSNEYLNLLFLKDEKMGLVQATANYIPMQKFKEAFELAGDMIKENGLESLIFDKRGLTNFHQCMFCNIRNPQILETIARRHPQSKHPYLLGYHLCKTRLMVFYLLMFLLAGNSRNF